MRSAVLLMVMACVFTASYSEFTVEVILVRKVFRFFPVRPSLFVERSAHWGTGSLFIGPVGTQCSNGAFASLFCGAGGVLNIGSSTLPFACWWCLCPECVREEEPDREFLPVFVEDAFVMACVSVG